MPTDYVYELWNGKAVVGFYKSSSPIYGKSVHIFETSILKEIYGRKTKMIAIPTMFRIVSTTYQDQTIRMVLDVRRKSKRQLQIITGGH
jgi:hypothetical protein